MIHKDKETNDFLSSLQFSLKQASERGIPQDHILNLVEDAYKPTSAPQQIEENQENISGSLKENLSSLKLEDLPKIPPIATIKDQYTGKEKTNIYAVPDQESLDAVKEIVPKITSIISLAFQGVGFVSQHEKDGFKTSDLFGYSPSFLRPDSLPSIKNTGLEAAYADIQKLMKSKAPICGDEHSFQNMIYGKNSNVVLLKDSENPSQVELLVKRAEPGRYYYPAFANPEWTRGIHCPLVISFESKTGAEELRDLLKKDPVKTIHTLVAIILTPGITTEFTSAENQQQIIENGVPKNDYYKQGVTGFMYIPGGFEPTKLSEA